MDQILQKASQAADEKTITSPNPSTGGAGNSPFQKELDSVLGQVGGADSMENLLEFVDKVFGVEKNGGINTVDASSVHVEIFGKEEAEKSKKAGRIDFASGEKIPGAGHIFEILKGINQDQLQFENLKEMISSGKTFRPQELLAIQVGVGHMTVELELLGKAMEAATKIPTQVVNMQIG